MNGAAYYRLGRLDALDQWWHWLLLAAIVLAVCAWIAVLYRRDGRELSRGTTLLLVLLRLAAFAGILIFFLHPEKRSDKQTVRASRAIVLVDTSQSMGLNDLDRKYQPLPSRSEQAIVALRDGPLLTNLRQQHDVVVYRFDQTTRPVEIVSLARTKSNANKDAPTDPQSAYFQSVAQGRTLLAIAVGVLLLALITAVMHWFFGQAATRANRESWSQLVAGVALIVGIVLVAVANLRSPDVPWQVLIGWQAPSASDLTSSSTEVVPVVADPVVDWVRELTPRGSETRLGDALRDIIDRERGGSIAAIIVATDGGQNAGVEIRVATDAASSAGIPIHAIGLGSDQLPRNLKLVELEAPPRVYPGDEFTITAYVQGSALAGMLADARLFSGPADAMAGELTEDLAQQRSFRLGADADVTPIAFKIKPTETGRRQYQVRVSTQGPDQDPRDNQRGATVEVVTRQNKVLVFASGPSREFRFLRNQLFRDRDTLVDVYLQTGQKEEAHEANKLLFEFPKTEADLFGYDCIVAFDPNWETLDETQVQLIERWVAEKAGGLIVVAGPVHTSHWAGRRRGDKRYDTIKSLYPVAFYTTGSATLNLGRTGGEAAWPLQFTREGQEADFLWLADDYVASETAWQNFGGVFGYFAVKDPKPGAKVFARFADPATAIDNELPIYMAGHYYGAGRVFFQASGEMWRLRSLDETYFDTYYTKLLRWVSQGRLMQDSSRGVLLVDKERCFLGEQLIVRAILIDAQRQPLTLPDVTANLLLSDGTRSSLKLTAVKQAPRPGTYAGQLTAMQLGELQIQMTLPDSVNERLTRTVRVAAPQREIEHPQRNDALLRDLTTRSGGQYFIGFDDALASQNHATLAASIPPQDQRTTIPGTPDRDFDRRLMTWLLGLISGALCLEWLLRRLSRLA